MNERLQVLLFCGLVTYLALFYQIGRLPFFGSDEPRYARIAEEMEQSGDFVTPHLEGRPWLEKPPLLFWLEAASFRVLGASEATARLPNAILAVAGALVMALLAYHLFGIRLALLSYLILVTTAMYDIFARAASTDLPLSVTFSAAVAAAYLAIRKRTLGWAAASGACLALAILAKGPVALVLFLGIFALYFLATGRFGWSLVQILVGGLTLLALAVPWFWLVWRANGHNFVMTFWVNHHLARFATNLHHHVEPFWFYLPLVILGFFPWVFFLGSSAVETWRARFQLDDEHVSFQLLLWIWALVPLVFFSLSSSKLAGYILPVFPPLALLAAIQWQRFVRGEIAVLGPMKVQLASLGAFSALLVPAFVIGFEFKYDAVLVGAIVSLPIVAAIFWGQGEFRRRRPVTLFLTLVAGMTLTLALTYRLASPVIARYHSTYAVIQAAKPEISRAEPLIFYRFFHHSARFYADYRTTREPINDPEHLLDYARKHPQARYLLLTKKEGYEQLARVAHATVVSHSGTFYLVQIVEPPDRWETG
ncbi:MAG: glycosyltransferase family 39 protein [Acidobacteriota bacterium]